VHARLLRGKPGSTKDGRHIALLANVAKPEDADAALEYGAEGIGLFRTEFMFMASSTAPSVEDQTKAYAKLLARFPGKKVVIRMLDAGADKPLDFLTPENEPNPALGLRGLRTLRTHRQILDDQLEALARADAQTDADLWVMAPMVADEHEAEYFVTLGKARGLKQVGVMAEVPSIALMAQEVAQISDFVSIGTNDLTQYTLAADRTLASVGSYQTAWHPAVLRAIKLIADAGNTHGMPVGVCGEAAADPDLALALVGLGVNSLSMTPLALDDVRANLAGHTMQEAQDLANRALSGEFYPTARH
jgi:phosphoenolpyruvate-protein phosphotransferase (PTS system enzyme I)